MMAVPDKQGPSRRSLTVAVVGAGAAGLVTARELLREGHEVTVFEQNARVGGVWDYREETETDDELGLDPRRRRVHSSLYEELRTNLPREIMSFSDFPLTPEAMGVHSLDPRRFCGHEEVQRFLELFASVFDLNRRIKLSTKVHRASPLPAEEGTLGPRWGVTYTQQGDSVGSNRQVTQTFDALISAIGNYHEPNLPDIPGLRSFPGTQLHCHNYRSRHRFKGQRVLVVGASFSGDEIARQIASVAREVVHSARTWNNSPHMHIPSNLQQWPMLTRLSHDGVASFEEGRRWRPDTIVYCTGYKYAYPWLPSNLLNIGDLRVGHLYNHIFHPHHAPTLAFVGLIVRSIRNFQFETQARYVARVLSGRVSLPTQGEMWEDIAGYYAAMKAAGVPVRYSHSQGKGHSPETQWQYNDKLIRASGPDVPVSPQWRKHLAELSYNAIFGRAETFRDEWTAEERAAYEAAHEQCNKILACHRASHSKAKL